MQEQNPTHVIAGAIIIAGALIAVAVYSRPTTSAPPAPTAAAANTANTVAALRTLRPVNADDHILGPIDAPIILVEYSDTECPFCKRFHYTMQEVRKTFGDGTIAWVYRHFPLSIHTKAPLESQALECAARQGGNNAFWRYLDGLFAVTPSNDGLDLSLLPIIANDTGLDVALFEQCLSENPDKKRIEADARNAISTGGRGTPWSIILGPNNAHVPVGGAESASVISGIIEELLAQESIK